MPRYDIKCEKCGDETIVTLKLSEYDNLPKCEKCGGKMSRFIADPPGTIYKGRWFRNSGSY